MKHFFLFISVWFLVFCKNKNLTGDPSTAPLTEMATLVSDPPTISSDFPFDVTVKDKDQNDISTTAILEKNGKPTVMMFWLTTCNPCSRELAAINQNYSSWQREVPFNLVAMSEDRDVNYPAFIQRVNSEQWPFNSYWDSNRTFKGILPGSLNGLPQTFIFNKKGKLVWQKRGYLPGWEKEIFENIKLASRS